jgi:hypothetical protein
VLRAEDLLSLDLMNVVRAVSDRRNRPKAARREASWSEQAAA